MFRILYRYAPSLFLHTNIVRYNLNNLHLGGFSELTGLGSVKLCSLQFPLLYITGDPHHGGLLQLPELCGVALVGLVPPLSDRLILQYVDLAGLFRAMGVSYSTTPP